MTDGGLLTLTHTGTVNNTSGTFQVDESGTLTVNTSTINHGTVTVAADTDSDAAGTLNLVGSAVIENGTLTNHGLIDVTTGTNELRTEAVTTDGALTVAAGATLNVDQGGSLSNSGTITVDGIASIDGSTSPVAVTNSNLVEVTDGGLLTLTHTGTVNNTSGTFQVDESGTLTVNTSTINHGTVTVAADTDSDAAGTLNLVGSAVIENGTLTNHGLIDVTTGTNELRTEAVTTDGALTVAAGATLNVDQGGSLSNSGTITVDGIASIDGSTSPVAVTNSNLVEVTDGGLLTLTHTGTVNNTSGTFQVDESGTLTVNTSTINHGTVTVAADTDSDAAGTLNLVGSAVIENGTLTNHGLIDVTTGTNELRTEAVTTDGALTVAAGATLNVDQGGSLSNSGTITVDGIASIDGSTSPVAVTNSNLVEVTDGGLLTLTHTGTVNNTSGTFQVDESGTLTVNTSTINHGTVTVAADTDSDAAGTLNLVGSAVIENGTLTNHGLIDVTTGTNELRTEAVTTDGALTVAAGATLNVDQGGSLSNSGTITVDGIASIDGSTSPVAVTNSNLVEVTDGGLLTLTHTGTVNNTSGTFQVDESGTLTVNTSTINHGTVTVAADTDSDAAGTLNLVGSAVIENGTLTNHGLIDVTTGTNELRTEAVTTDGALTVAAGATLNVDQGGSLSNSGTITVDGIASIDGSTSPVAVTNSNLVEVTDGGLLTLTHTGTVNNTSGTFQVDESGTLTVNTSTINHGTVTVAADTDSDAAGTLNLVGSAVIENGTLTNHGLIDVTTGTNELRTEAVTTDGALTVAAGATLNVDQGGSLSNSGTITVDGIASIDGSTSPVAVTNSNLVEVTDGGLLTLTHTGTVNNTSGTFQVDESGTLTVNTSTINHGTVTVAADTDSDAAGTLNLVGSAVIENGTLTNHGLIDVTTGTNELRTEAVTTDGALTVAAGATLNVDQGGSLSNSGTITVDGIASIDGSTSPVAVTNSNLVEVTDGGLLTLTHTGTVNNTSGTFQVDESGTLTVNTSTINHGTVTVAADTDSDAAGTLNLVGSAVIENGTLTNHGLIDVTTGTNELRTEAVTTDGALTVAAGATLNVDQGGSLSNSGTITVDGIASIDGSTSPVAVTNSNLVEVTDGGLLTLTHTGTVNNTSGTFQVDESGTLTVNTSTINHGTVTVAADTDSDAAGTLNLVGSAVIENGTLTNHGLIDVTTGTNELRTEAVTTDGALTVAAGATLNVDQGGSLSNSGTITVDGIASIDGSTSPVAVTNSNLVEVTDGGLLTLTHTGTVNNTSGTFQVDESGTLTVNTSTINHGTVTVAADTDSDAAGTLNLVGSAVIENGTLTNHGLIDVTTGTNELRTEAVTTDGALTVAAGATLNVDQGGSLSNSGTITVDGIASIDGSTSPVAVTNSNLVEVTDGGLLTLTHTGTVNNTSGTFQVDESGTLTVNTSTINHGTVTVAADTDSDAAGTLNLVGSAVIENGTLTNHGLIDVTTGTNELRTEAVTTDGALTVAAGATLNVDQGGSLSNSGTITVDGIASIDGSTSPVAVTNSNLVEVTDGGLLTLTHTGTVNNTSGTFQVDESGTLTVNTSTINHGTVTVAADTDSDAAGTLNLVGSAVIENGTLTNHGLIDVTTGTNELRTEAVTTDGALTVAAGATLNVDQGGSLSNSGTITVNGIASIDGSPARSPSPTATWSR